VCQPSSSEISVYNYLFPSNTITIFLSANFTKQTLEFNFSLKKAMLSTAEMENAQA